jgi:hypothetical protein
VIVKVIGLDSVGSDFGRADRVSVVWCFRSNSTWPIQPASPPAYEVDGLVSGCGIRDGHGEATLAVRRRLRQVGRRAVEGVDPMIMAPARGSPAAFVSVPPRYAPAFGGSLA